MPGVLRGTHIQAFLRNVVLKALLALNGVGKSAQTYQYVSLKAHRMEKNIYIRIELRP